MISKLKELMKKITKTKDIGQTSFSGRGRCPKGGWGLNGYLQKSCKNMPNSLLVKLLKSRPLSNSPQLGRETGLLHFVCNDRMVAFCHASIPQAFRISYKKVAFTLAEILITLGIIGIVAAITLPTLMKNITVRLQSEREANIVQKITKSMEMMKVDGKLNTTYESTDAFVDEFQKYIKIAQRCDSSNLDKCWGVKKVTNSKKEEYEVKNAIKGKHLSIMSNKTDNVGLVLADGTPIILTYNENASPISDTEQSISSFKELPVGFGKTKRFAYTTGVTAPIAFVMDTNGGKGPNKEKIDDKYYDIRGFNGASFSYGCNAIYVGGLCLINGGNMNVGEAQEDTWMANNTKCSRFATREEFARAAQIAPVEFEKMFNGARYIKTKGYVIFPNGGSLPGQYHWNGSVYCIPKDY